MRTFTADTWLTAAPDEVLDMLTNPVSISRWSPVPFDLVELDGERLRTGSRARVRGHLAGRRLEFVVDVEEASEDCLALVATGPLTFEVEYLVLPCDCGSEINAAVTVAGTGMLGRVLARAAETLLAAGALRAAVEKIALELQPGRPRVLVR